MLQQWSETSDEEEASDKELQQGIEGEVGSNHEDNENSDLDTEPCGTDSSVLGLDSSKCEALCCGTSDSISQPKDKTMLSKTKSFKSGKERCFLPLWYDQFKWIHFCQSRLKVFCFYCMKASKSSACSTRADQAFVASGFSNWKKAIEKFKQHERSLAHRNALITLAVPKVPINEQLLRDADNTKRKHRQSLLKQLSALRYLLRQGIAIRNDHVGGSNLTIMLQMVLEESTWVKDGKYQSPECINEMIEIMGHKVLRSLISDIQSQKWYSILADETRDLSNREQMVICLRYVSDEYEVFEDLIGLVQLDNITADTIYSALKDSITRLGLDFANCRGQGYDGARNFQGHVKGVAKRFQDDYPAAISVHCLAHCINLTLQEATRSCNCIKQALNFSMEAIQLIKLSPKRQVLFESIQKREGSQVHGIKTLCPTRWTVRTAAMQALITNYRTLEYTMQEASVGSDDCSRRASGVAALMEKFQTFFGLKLSVLLFGITEQLSTTLQGREINVDDSFMAVKLCLQTMQRLRTNCEFGRFFENVKSQASDLCEHPVLPRIRRPPRRVDDGASPHVFPSVEEYYRREYFEAIDIIKGELERRFAQENFLFARQTEELLLSSANAKPINLPERMKSIYCNDVDMDKLMVQLRMLPDAVKTTTLDGITIKQVTRIQTLCQVFNNQPSLKILLSEIHNLLRIYLTIPVTTSTAERSFSALRRIKTFLRTSMSQARLNHCMLLHVLSERTDKLLDTDTAKEFAERNERRKNYFGQF